MCSTRQLWVRNIYFFSLITSNQRSTRISCSGATCVLLWVKGVWAGSLIPMEVLIFSSVISFYPFICIRLRIFIKGGNRSVLQCRVNLRTSSPYIASGACCHRTRPSISRLLSRAALTWLLATASARGLCRSNSYYCSLSALRSLRVCVRTRFARALNSGEPVSRMRLNKNNEGGGNRRCWNQKWREKFWRMIIADSWKKPPRKRFKVSGQYRSHVELFLLVLCSGCQMS